MEYEAALRLFVFCQQQQKREPKTSNQQARGLSPSVLELGQVGNLPSESNLSQREKSNLSQQEKRQDGEILVQEARSDDSNAERGFTLLGVLRPFMGSSTRGAKNDTRIEKKEGKLSPQSDVPKLTPILQLRRNMLHKYGTWYGCDEDPTIRAMKGKDVVKPSRSSSSSSGFLRRTSNSSFPSVPIRLQRIGSPVMETLVEPEFERPPLGFLREHQISPIATSPYRIGLLFMINRELRHPRLWTQWLEHAYLWSYKLYGNREGPFSAVGDEPFAPLFSLHVHFMGHGGSGFYTSLKNVWRKWGLLAVEDSLKEAADDPRLQLPQIFQDAIIPSVHCGWGDLNPCEHQLLKYGLNDPSTNGFIFLSESTLPVKPFQFMYDEFQSNPRSRFFFSNINLPLVKKHHQWIVLNRQHAARLADHPEKWCCGSWMVHHYPHWHVIGNFAASDEYLPFYAIGDLVGIDTIMLEVNAGQAQDLRVFNNTYQVHGNRNFRHTWLCWWELPDYIDSEPCGVIGEYSTRLSSPVTYSKVFGPEFQNIVIQNRNVWFARKFEKDCTVQLNNSRSTEDVGDADVVADSSAEVSKSEDQRTSFEPVLLEDWIADIILNDDVFSSCPKHEYSDKQRF